MEMLVLGAPLWPAGHLPRKGGDYAFIDAGTDRKRRRMGAERGVIQSPPLRRRCPAGQRGALSRRHFRFVVTPSSREIPR